MNAPPLRTDRWVAFHLHHHGDLDALLHGLVAPLVRGLLAAGRVDAFHHYRYQLGGPHVRLRLHLTGPAAAVSAAVRGGAAAYFAAHPSAPLPEAEVRRRNRALAEASEADRPLRDLVVPADTVRERPWSSASEPDAAPAERPAALALATASSIASLGHRLPPGAPAGARLPHVARLLVRQAWGLAGDAESFAALLRVPAGFPPRIAGEATRLADAAFARGEEGLCALLLREAAALADRPADCPLAEASRAFTRAFAPAGGAAPPALAARQLHMTANRCGLWNREEVYLARILSLAAGRLRDHAGWRGAWAARAALPHPPSLAACVRRATAAFAAAALPEPDAPRSAA